MICKICGYNERDDNDCICDDCKVSLISSSFLMKFLIYCTLSLE
jgi:hypothetical protein